MASDLGIAKLTLFCEASGESRETKLAVAYCMFNRLLDGRFGTTLAEVCLHRKHFSCWDDDYRNNANLLRGARTPDNDPVMRECEDVLERAQGWAFEDTTGGATHYIDSGIAPPSWTNGAQIALLSGRLTFYKGVA